MIKKSKQNHTEAYHIQPAKNERSRKKNLEEIKGKQNLTCRGAEILYLTSPQKACKQKESRVKYLKG